MLPRGLTIDRRRRDGKGTSVTVLRDFGDPGDRVADPRARAHDPPRTAHHNGVMRAHRHRAVVWNVRSSYDFFDEIRIPEPIRIPEEND